MLYWLVRAYSDGPAPHVPAYDRTLVPDPERQARASQAELDRAERTMREQAHAETEALRQQAAELAARLQQVEDREAAITAERAQLDAIREQTAQKRAVAVAQPDPHDYDEQATRTLLIDVLLREAGWPLDDAKDREYPVDGMPTASGKRGNVDYVLWDDAGRPLAVVEAKRARKDLRNGQHQATCTPTVWKRSSVAARSSSTPTATPSRSGTTPKATRRVRFWASTPRPNWSR